MLLLLLLLLPLGAARMTHPAGAIRIARVMAAQLSVATLAQRVLARLVQQSAVLTPPHRISYT